MNEERRWFLKTVVVFVLVLVLVTLNGCEEGSKLTTTTIEMDLTNKQPLLAKTFVTKQNYGMDGTKRNGDEVQRDIDAFIGSVHAVRVLYVFDGKWQPPLLRATVFYVAKELP